MRSNLHRENYAHNGTIFTVIMNLKTMIITIHTSGCISKTYTAKEYEEFEGNMKAFAITKLFPDESV